MLKSHRYAWVVESVDTRDLKSCDHYDRAGSIPAPGTTLNTFSLCPHKYSNPNQEEGEAQELSCCEIEPSVMQWVLFEEFYSKPHGKIEGKKEPKEETGFYFFIEFDPKGVENHKKDSTHSKLIKL